MSQAMPAEPENFRETILQGLAKVMQEQLDFRQNLTILQGRMVTIDDVEKVITDRFMTRQEFKEQREKDLALWRKSTKTFYGALGGCGCLLVIGLVLASLLSAGAVWGVFQFWLH